MAVLTGTSGNLKTGFMRVEARLNRELRKIKDRTNKGLIIAAAEIRQDMERTPPYIPLDYSNLQASWFIVTKKTADASVRVLEVKGGNFTNADSPKILAKLRTNHPQVLADVRGQLEKYSIGVGIGFSAFYATAVHEKMDPNIKWKKEGSGPKFFQAALYRNIATVVTIVRNEARVRP